MLKKYYEIYRMTLQGKRARENPKQPTNPLADSVDFEFLTGYY